MRLTLTVLGIVLLVPLSLFFGPLGFLGMLAVIVLVALVTQGR